MLVMNPLISIIVPNYNHENYLKQRLDSIFSQTYQNIEVILLDDYSTDNSRQILSEYAKNSKVSHCVFNKLNSGNTFAQWKKGLDLAKGDYIWIAESDDFCESNFLDMLAKPLRENDEVVISYCQSNKVDEKGIVIGNWKGHTNSFKDLQFEENFVMDGNLFIEKYLIYKNIIPNASAVLFKRKNLKISDSLIKNNQLKYCGDWVVYLEQIVQFKIAFIADSINNFRFHTNSVIAKASKSENRVNIIDIDFKMRKIMTSFLRKNKPLNYNAIVSNNRKIIKLLKYEKAIFLIENNRKWEGIIILLTIFDEFWKRYRFKKKLTLKLKKIFQSSI